jgi:glycosyltransferase involved in cell wall biosynthesis
MPYNIRIVSTYPPRKCGVGTFSRNLTQAFETLVKHVNSVRVAAIDKDNLSYSSPVDLILDQYNSESWKKATEDIISTARRSSDQTVVVLQHEYGLDPDAEGNDARGTNFVEMAKELYKEELITLVYLHTVLDTPDELQRKILQDFADITDGILVPTESAVDILESGTYGIPRTKIKHIDHGIRMQNPSHHDRQEIKRKYGLEDRYLITTPGMHSPGKGLQYALRGYGRFIEESCTEEQRRKIIYLIAGPCHPEFIKAEGGRYYREYTNTLDKALKESGLNYCKVDKLAETDLACCDVVFYDAFLEEEVLVDFYAATNTVLLPYLNLQQISSGVLADTVGSGRVAIASKFRYAVELLNPGSHYEKGLVIGSHARGILVDAEESSVEQIAQALDYLVFNADKRLAMEKRTHRRGYQMRWDNTAWAMLQYILFLNEELHISTGRGITFKRNKKSVYEKKNKKLLS